MAERSIEDRVLVLETRYEERDKQLQAALNDIRAELAKISNGGMAICATHGQSITQVEANLALLKAEIVEVRHQAEDSIRRVWAQLWAFVGICATAGIGVVIAHVTGAL